MLNKPSDEEGFCGEAQSFKPVQKKLHTVVVAFFAILGADIFESATFIIKHFFGYSLEFESFVIGCVISSVVLVVWVERKILNIQNS